MAIIRLSTTICIASCKKEAMDKLRDYVRSIMKQKGLSVPEIAKRSGNKIKKSYIFDILSGKTKYISVDKLNALAKGLDIDGVELYKAASGDIPLSDPAAELTAIFKIVLDMTPKERTMLLASLRKKK
jgi:transcriptional regulator with XRE-family HTH domain